MTHSPHSPIPTQQDHENARRRQEIAAHQRAEYDWVSQLALDKFGPGWLPLGRHFLLDKDDEDRCRQTGARPIPAATVYSVRSEDGQKRHLFIEGDLVKEVSGYEEGFGAMLLERHPTLRIEVQGKQVAPHRYSLCWAPIETYQPRSAEQLATMRINRERNKAERAEKKYAEDYPLFAMIESRDKGEGHGR